MDSQRTRIDIESGRLTGRRDVSSACLISFICKGFEMLFNPKKRALAAFFVILEAISCFLDGFQKSQRIIRIVAFLLSVLGFLMTLLTGISERNSMANRVQAEKQLRAVEIGFSVVQLIATFMALVGTKIMNNYMSSILLVFFAVIAYGSTFVKDEGGSDTSGVENSTSSIELLHIASNANEIDEQLHIASTPNEIGEHSDLANTSNEMDDTEISQPLLSMLINIGNMVFLMRLTSTWILQTLIESLMSISLIRISILQVFLVMRLMSILVLRALVMRVMSILALQALVKRVMSILVLRALVMRVMSILVLRALLMRLISILVLRALEMTVMSILVLRALVMRVMSILVLHTYINSVSQRSLRSVEPVEIFSKFLSEYDISERLSIPTSALRHFESFEGQCDNHVVVKDWNGEEWNFRFSTRRIGHPRPVFTGQWLTFAQDKGLKPDDLLIFIGHGDGQKRIEVIRETDPMLFGQAIIWARVDQY
ncbi:hypothetical protein Patl1_22277 [Pistacia atlantica]|uniref:Uncharacterized protein n=1 Tax=Pistacia atlantica TaxID=434234 RepID=A0ACC1A0J0_9ROSI|nr:hypothetical protein Patl1_22277 [Pistacia atlantica]